MKKWILGFLYFYSSVLFAAKPILLFSPNGTLPQYTPPNGVAVALYTVTNNVPYTLQDLTLNYEPIGKTPLTVTQNTSLTNIPATCASPFTLAPGQSCTLALDISGLAVGGPEVCFGGPNPSRCSFPSSADQLNVTPTAGLAYITDKNYGAYNKTSVSLCLIEAVNGLLVDCQDAGISVDDSYVTDLAFATFDGTDYAYFSDLPTFPAYCEVLTNKTFDSCAILPDSDPPSVPESSCGVATFTTDDTYVYLSTCILNDLVYRCSVTASSGEISDCVKAETNTNLFKRGAALMTFHHFGTKNYVYIGNDSATTDVPGGIVQCEVSSIGKFSSCAHYTNAGQAAREIAFAQVNGDDYGYVAVPFQDGPSYPGSLMKCLVNTLGDLVSCTEMTPTVVSGAIESPRSLNLTTVNGQLYAYVVDFVSGGDPLGEGIVWKCSVNAQTGDFDTCVNSSPDSPFLSPLTINIPVDSVDLGLGSF